MKLMNAWSLMLAGLVTAAIAASCSATSENRFSGAASGAGGMGAGTGNGTMVTVGSTSTATGTGGGIVLGDGGKMASSSSGGPHPTTCDASCGLAGGTCNAGTCVVSDNTGNVDPGTQGKLMAGGSADPSFAWLYPYDKTVFPRGLVPPTLQFAGTDPTAVFVHVTFPGMDYQGWYGGSSPARVVFAAPIWKAITLAALAGVDVQVDVTKISGTAVSGPITETWSIAQGSLRGTIYYETYDSQILGGLGSVGVMKIQPGSTAPVPLLSGCGSVCHTASADGSTLVAAGPGPFLSNSTSYDLTDGGATIFAAPNQAFIYGALYPDGSLCMSATGYRTALPSGFPGGVPSRLWDTKTGANIPAAGWDNVITNGGTPAFSPDGKQLAFNHFDTGGGHTLDVMDFNIATMTFSNDRQVASNGSMTLAWPAFTPDGKWVLFHAGSNAQFETDADATGDVYFTSSTSSMVARLDALDGYKTGGVGSYLPANDPGLSFAPTVLPEAAGGYYWVVFTSHRSYGNTLASKVGPSGSPDEYGKLWVSAFDINAAPGKDASHPAFFLDGQELTSDNLRGFWVLNPCKQLSNDCTSGDDCCSGFCRSEDGGPSTCIAPPGGCSNEYELCSTAADCCNPSDECINGRCAQPPVQ